MRIKKEKVYIDFQKSLERLDIGWARTYGKQLDRQKEMKMGFPEDKKA